MTVPLRECPKHKVKSEKITAPSLSAPKTPGERHLREETARVTRQRFPTDRRSTSSLLDAADSGNGTGAPGARGSRWEVPATPLPGTFLPRARHSARAARACAPAVPAPPPPRKPAADTTPAQRRDAQVRTARPGARQPLLPHHGRQTARAPRAPLRAWGPRTLHLSPHLGDPPGSARGPRPAPGAHSRRYTWRSRRGAETARAWGLEADRWGSPVAKPAPAGPQAPPPREKPRPGVPFAPVRVPPYPQSFEVGRVEDGQGN